MLISLFWIWSIVGYKFVNTTWFQYSLNVFVLQVLLGFYVYIKLRVRSQSHRHFTSPLKCYSIPWSIIYCLGTSFRVERIWVVNETRLWYLCSGEGGRQFLNFYLETKNPKSQFSSFGFLDIRCPWSCLIKQDPISSFLSVSHDVIFSKFLLILMFNQTL